MPKPPPPHRYVTIDQLKASLSITSTDWDADLTRAADAATAVVDSITRRYFLTGAASEIRYFTPISPHYLYIADVISITQVVSSGSSFIEGEPVSNVILVENTDYYLDETDTLRVLGGFRFWPGKARSVQVTAQWGFASVPQEVVEATQIIATQLFKRVREAPFGVLATSLDGPAVRLGREDPQVRALLGDYKRTNMIE